ncbi:DUF222 domain-containing protein [Actinocrispum sp. NPDC049592]|uniref:HNH endonuclease signature motif containing protein n=1 Tax=Actinocrispum sp. NPDC049592 TaxID=3154835 RepID=UPI00343E37D0
MQGSGNYWGKTKEEIVAALQASETQARRIHHGQLELVAFLNNQGLATELGYSNPAALLVHALRISPKEAKLRLAQAEALFPSITPTGSVIEPALPATSAALAAGGIGSEAVDVIRKTLKDLPDLEPEKLALAESTMVAQAAEDDPNALARFGTRVRNIVDPDGPPPPDPEPKQPDRMLHIRARRDGGLDFRGHLPAEDAHLLHPVIKKGEQRPSDRTDDRCQAERVADAFVETLRMAAQCPAKPTKNGLRTPVAITISYEDLLKELDDRILVGPDTYLTAREARRIACDSHVFPAVLGSKSEPLDIGVSSYTVPAHIRRALILRDGGCAFPSCGVPASACDGHHIVHWRNHGPTKVDNLVLLCPHHHRLVHRSDWTIQMVDRAPQFIPPAYIDPSRTPRTNSARRPPQPRTPLPTAA